VAVIRLTRPGFPGVTREVASADRTRSGGTATESAAAAAETISISAASTEEDVPRASILGLGYGGVIAAGIVTFILDNSKTLPPSLVLAPDMNAFALIYVAAQGVERLIEPFSHFVLSTTAEKKKIKTETAAATTAASLDDAMAALGRAATAKAKVNLKKSERAVIFWALATVVGIAASAALGLRFLAAILAPPAAEAAPAVAPWADVVLTGLVIGAGSKGLHDLIQKLQKPADAGDGEEE
jgi:hypothetical protein